MTYKEAVAAANAAPVDAALSREIQGAEETFLLAADIANLWAKRLRVQMPMDQSILIALTTAIELGVRIGREMEKEPEAKEPRVTLN